MKVQRSLKSGMSGKSTALLIDPLVSVTLSGMGGPAIREAA